MIYYIAHWDWILLQSRAEVVKSLQQNYKIEGIAPLEDNKHLLSDYSQLHDWKINRKKLFDIAGIIDLRKKISEFKHNDLIHLFTLKTLILYLLSSLLLKKQFSVIASITGLGYLFSNTKLSKILRLIIRPLVIRKINSCVDILIFQNELDKDTFIEFSKYKNRIILIEGSGLNTTNFQTKKSFNKNIKVIFVGRLLKEKGIFEFLKIAESFKHDNNIKFFVAGDLDKGKVVFNNITESTSGDQYIFSQATGSDNNDSFLGLIFRGDKLNVTTASVEVLSSNAVFRDVSAWYHIVWVLDTQNATDAYKTRLYVNGTIRSWIHYVELRSANGTQKEHMELAIAIGKAINKIFPLMEDFHARQD